jgi:hypothetical protein
MLLSLSRNYHLIIIKSSHFNIIINSLSIIIYIMLPKAYLDPMNYEGLNSYHLYLHFLHFLPSLLNNHFHHPLLHLHHQLLFNLNYSYYLYSKNYLNSLILYLSYSNSPSANYKNHSNQNSTIKYKNHSKNSNSIITTTKINHYLYYPFPSNNSTTITTIIANNPKPLLILTNSIFPKLFVQDPQINSIKLKYLYFLPILFDSTTNKYVLGGVLCFH